MSQVTWIKNTTASSKTWVGQTVAAGAYYQIPEVDRFLWGSSNTVITDIGSGDAVISTTNAASGHLGKAEGVRFLNGNLTEIKSTSRLSQDNVATHEFGDSWTATKNTTHVNYTAVPTKYIQGGYLEVEKHIWPNDTVDIKLVDKDNLLGYGADFTLNHFVEDIPLRKDGKINIKSHAISGAIPSGMYLKTSITSTGTVDDIKCALEVYGYDDA